MTEKRDEILILRVSPSDKERIRMKMEELGISNMSAKRIRPGASMKKMSGT